jgi:hypothetical protein
VEREGTNHVVRLQHFAFGRALITFDDVVVYNRPRKLFDTGFNCAFHRDGVEYIVRVVPRPLGFRYEIAVDGVVRRTMDWTGAYAAGALLLAMVALVVVLGEFDNEWGSGFDGVGMLCFVAVGITLYWLVFSSWRTRVLTVLALIGLYVGSYVWLSALGGYYLSQSGRWRWEGIGLAEFDVVVWHPKHVQWEPFVNFRGKHTHRATLLGWFYSPLIVADRAWVHPTEQLM